MHFDGGKIDFYFLEDRIHYTRKQRWQMKKWNAISTRVLKRELDHDLCLICCATIDKNTDFAYTNDKDWICKNAMTDLLTFR